MLKILIVDDEKNIRRLIAAVLNQNGFETVQAENGRQALDIINSNHMDLIIADVMMPVMDGFGFIKELRAGGNQTPVLMITAKNMLNDKKEGFNAGADDYLTKPFDEEEMLLRVNALLKRARISAERQIIIGQAVINYESLTVSRGSEEYALPKKEFLMLYKLLSYPGRIFTRAQFMDEFWGMDSESSDHTVDVHINRLRKRLEGFTEFEIVTIRGLGYKAVKKHE